MTAIDIRTSAEHAPPRGALLVLTLAALAYALAQTAVIPAMGGMVQSLHTSPENVSWVITGYLVSAAILTPVLGRLGDMFGKRLVLVISLLIFAAGGAMAAMAGNIWLVVAARVLQGTGGGIFPLCFGIISDRFGRKWPLVAAVLMFSVVEMASGFVQTFQQFIAVRSQDGSGRGHDGERARRQRRRATQNHALAFQERKCVRPGVKAADLIVDLDRGTRPVNDPVVLRQAMGICRLGLGLRRFRRGAGGDLTSDREDVRQGFVEIGHPCL